MYALWFHDETFIAIWFCLQVVADFFFTLGAFFCKLGTESKGLFFFKGLTLKDELTKPWIDIDILVETQWVHNLSCDTKFFESTRALC